MQAPQSTVRLSFSPTGIPALAAQPQVQADNPTQGSHPPKPAAATLDATVSLAPALAESALLHTSKEQVAASHSDSAFPALLPDTKVHTSSHTGGTPDMRHHAQSAEEDSQPLPHMPCDKELAGTISPAKSAAADMELTFASLTLRDSPLTSLSTPVLLRPSRNSPASPRPEHTPESSGLDAPCVDNTMAGVFAEDVRMVAAVPAHFGDDNQAPHEAQAASNCMEPALNPVALPLSSTTADAAAVHTVQEYKPKPKLADADADPSQKMLHTLPVTAAAADTSSDTADSLVVNAAACQLSGKLQAPRHAATSVPYDSTAAVQSLSGAASVKHHTVVTAAMLQCPAADATSLGNAAAAPQHPAAGATSPGNAAATRSQSNTSAVQSPGNAAAVLAWLNALATPTSTGSGSNHYSTPSEPQQATPTFTHTHVSSVPGAADRLVASMPAASLLISDKLVSEEATAATSKQATTALPEDASALKETTAVSRSSPVDATPPAVVQPVPSVRAQHTVMSGLTTPASAATHMHRWVPALLLVPGLWAAHCCHVAGPLRAQHGIGCAVSTTSTP